MVLQGVFSLGRIDLIRILYSFVVNFETNGLIRSDAKPDLPFRMVKSNVKIVLFSSLDI